MPKEIEAELRIDWQFPPVPKQIHTNDYIMVGLVTGDVVVIFEGDMTIQLVKQEGLGVLSGRQYQVTYIDGYYALRWGKNYPNKADEKLPILMLSRAQVTLKAEVALSE